ncbi:MAG: DNA-directed DNA polymerase II small subunit [Halobacteriota archaeon]
MREETKGMITAENGRVIEIVKRFADLGFHVQPEVIDLLSQYEVECERDSGRYFDINAIVESVANSSGPSVFVISTEQVSAFIHNSGLVKSIQKAPAIIKSFSDNGRGVEYKDFLPHFLDRYERLSGIIRRRVNCGQIRFLRNGRVGEDVSVVGMVASVNKTAKGNLLVDLEDPSGHMSVILPPHEEIIPDEIIGVTGSLLDRGFLFGNRVIHPDVPIPSSSSQSSLPSSSNHACGSKEHVYAVLISDLHVGSNTFLEATWYSFTQWLNEEAKRVNIAYLIVAGDVVDGIGIYPAQEDDLAITDIEEQYKIAGRYFHEFSSHVHVVVAPGNHDAVRTAEPQPSLPPEYQKYFPDNTCFVSNPAYIRIGDRLVLMYHGQSFDDFVNSVPRLNYSNPEEMMEEMLKKRHVAPIYGNSVSIVPDGHDYGVIDPVPEIFHCGHSHTVGIAKYRGVLLVNSGTWQSQTPYQKKLNINPVPGCATLVDISTRKAKVMNFGCEA